MVTIRNIENTTVYFLFSLFIPFSAIEIRLVFPQTKFMISWLQWLEKSWGAHARWCAIAIFQLTELNIKANPPCFARARAHVRALMTRKSCAVEMRNAILRNYLKNWHQFVFYGNKFSNCPLSLSDALQEFQIYVSVCILTIKISQWARVISVVIVKLILISIVPLYLVRETWSSFFIFWVGYEFSSGAFRIYISNPFSCNVITVIKHIILKAWLTKCTST